MICTFCDQERGKLIKFQMGSYYILVEENHGKYLGLTRLGCKECSDAFRVDPEDDPNVICYVPREKPCAG